MQAANEAYGARDDARAEGHLAEVVSILNKASAPDRSLRNRALRGLLAVRWRDGHIREAEDVAKQLIREGPEQLQLGVLGRLASPDRLLNGDNVAPEMRGVQDPYLQAMDRIRVEVDRIIAVLLNAHDAGPELATALILRKGLVQEAETGLRSQYAALAGRAPSVPDPIGTYARPLALRTPPSTESYALLDALRANASATSLLAYADPNIKPELLPKPRQLQQERTELERQLARSVNVSWGAESLADIERGLPPNTLLLEYVTYVRPATLQQPTAEPHYLALALTQKGVLGTADLGPTQAVDALVTTACRAILAPAEAADQCGTSAADKSGLQAVGRKLYDALLGPFRQNVEGTPNLIISADGPLNFLPFDVLAGTQNRYLIQDHVISYVSSSREIAAWAHDTPSRSPAVVFGDPDYGAGGNAVCSAEPGTRRGPVTRDEHILSGFPRLCGSGAEADKVAAALGGAKVLKGGGATEEAVKTLWGPRVVHFATHGYAVDELSWPRSWFSPEYQMWWDVTDYAVLRNDPMLRAGLVLAGANIRKSPGGHDDGMLSAAEASLLDLTGTQLVVLSACDSGLGLPRAGEGVFGLRKAFVLAGARAETVSLWPISEQMTGEFMARYYALLAQGKGNAEVLALVKREFMAAGDPKNDPFTWAVFAAYGYPGALGK
jgi:CHAT domain-containing protein